MPANVSLTIGPDSTSPPMEPLLTATGLSKRFPGVIALDGVDFTVSAGEIHALMGENGAGKSTLIKVLTGVYPKDGGTLILGGQNVHPTSPLHAQKLGIATVYQEVNLVPGLSIAENIYLGRFPKKWGRIDRKTMNRGAAEALARLDVKLDVTKPLGSLSTALQQMVAIARALSLSAKVLILDEPTSSLDRAEVAQLFDAMRRLKSQGLGIVFVTHFLDQVYAVSDRITVLRNGRLVGSYPVADLPRPALVSKMVGKDISELKHEKAEAANAAATDTSVLVEAKNLSRKGSVGPLDISINEAEIVGLAGLLGSGRTETARLLFAADKHDTGEIMVRGEKVSLKTPRQAIAHGFAFCPEDRKLAGILPDLSIRENIIIALQARRGWWRPISRRKARHIAQEYIQALAIKTPDAEKPIRLLSGGNQQKAILARWLAASPSLLIVDEPTRGIDIGAKAEIATLLERCRAKGMSVLLISSEIEEITKSANRVLILRDRKKIGEVGGAAGGEISEQAILKRIAG